MRIACFIMGVIFIFGIQFKTDFKTFNDFIATIIVLLFPLILMITPLILEYLERRK